MPPARVSPGRTLLQAVATVGWRAPTLIQAHTIREALTGKDVLARARTGSGKTGAYVLSVLNSILAAKRDGGFDADAEPAVRAVVLVPTKELSQQASKDIATLAQFCGRAIAVVDTTGDDALDRGRAMLAERPDIVVGTPTRV